MTSEPPVAVGRIAVGKNGSRGVIYAIEGDQIVVKVGDGFKRVSKAAIVRCIPSELEKAMFSFGLTPIPLPNGCIADSRNLQKPTHGSEMRRRLSGNLKNQSPTRS